MLSPLAIQELKLTKRTTPEPEITSVPQIEETHKSVPAVTKPVKHPWYNDLSHQITDNTLFRLLLIAMVVDWLRKLELFK